MRGKHTKEFGVGSLNMREKPTKLFNFQLFKK